MTKLIPGICGWTCFLLLILSFPDTCSAQADKADYLKEIKKELKKKWPENRTINLVFHGHSVPSGYFQTPAVNTFGSYPFILLQELKELYPTAVVNVITTSIGGENSVQGQKRFKKEVLPHRPDVLFIDYALNDRSIGLEASKEAMEKMIRKALKKDIKIILLTPSPDLRVDLLAPGNELALFTRQITDLASTYNIGLVDSYARFRDRAAAGEDLKDLMAQVNHPNEKGHTLIAQAIIEYFK